MNLSAAPGCVPVRGFALLVQPLVSRFAMTGPSWTALGCWLHGLANAILTCRLSTADAHSHDPLCSIRDPACWFHAMPACLAAYLSAALVGLLWNDYTPRPHAEGINAYTPPAMRRWSQLVLFSKMYLTPLPPHFVSGVCCLDHL